MAGTLFTISMFACWFQPELINHGTVFFSHNKPAPARLISPETNQRIDSKIGRTRVRCDYARGEVTHPRETAWGWDENLEEENFSFK